MPHKRRVRLGKDAKDRSGLEPKEALEEASGDEAAAPPAGAPPQPKAVGPVEREKATQRAVEAIKQGLKEHPNAQKDGTPFLLSGWSEQFKPILGSYRKFVERCSAFTVQPGDKPHKYTIRIQDGKAPAQTSKKEWELRLLQCWKSYVQGVKQEDRNPKDFVEFARELAYQTSRQQIKKQKAAANKANPGDEAASDQEEVKASGEAPKKKKRKVVA